MHPVVSEIVGNGTTVVFRDEITISLGIKGWIIQWGIEVVLPEDVFIPSSDRTMYLAGNWRLDPALRHPPKSTELHYCLARTNPDGEEEFFIPCSWIFSIRYR